MRLNQSTSTSLLIYTDLVHPSKPFALSIEINQVLVLNAVSDNHESRGVESREGLLKPALKKFLTLNSVFRLSLVSL